MAIDLALACHDYAWTAPLHEGHVEPEGVNLTAVNYPNPERFSRMVRNLEFDACEMSMGTYMATRRDADRFPFTAIPVFPFRKFRHSYMYKHSDAGIDDPADLAGRRVGIVNWQTTTGIWQRGVLDEHHDLDIRDVEWVAGGSEIVDFDVPEGFDVEYQNYQGSTIDVQKEMLERGDIDALYHPVDSDANNATRLFDDAKAVERDYYEQTSIFPIMHAIVLRDDLLERERWVVQKLYDAFEEAKDIGLSVLERPREIPLVWADVYEDEQRELFGEDPWEYGLTEGNRITLKALIEYAHDQGVAAEQHDLDELFFTETLDTGYYA